MGWFLIGKLFSVLITLVRLERLSETEKDLEILLLRQQISILLRTHDQPVCATRFEKLTDSGRHRSQVEGANSSFCKSVGGVHPFISARDSSGLAPRIGTA
jgi:hypothetical protein